MWISSIAVLFGPGLDSEIERARADGRARPAERDIQPPMRQAPKEDPAAEAERVSREAPEEMAAEEPLAR